MDRTTTFSHADHAAGFPIAWIFERNFEGTVKSVIFESIVQPVVRDRLLRALRKYLSTRYEVMRKSSDLDAAALHLQQLSELRSQFRSVRSHKTCFGCLRTAPEKVFSCGHAICDVCVRIFGQRYKEDKYTFNFPECPFCGTQDDLMRFQLIPPTAGIRVLGLDGGGVKGVIPLLILRELEKRTADFQMPPQNFFDFAFGTSAGKLSKSNVSEISND